MTHRVPAAASLLAVLPLLLLLFLPHLAWAQLRVEAQLSSQELPSIQPVQLTLTAIATDGAAATPDLSVLDPDFQVLDRRVERRATVTNGKRREELRLRLMLLPRHAGELELPGIPFGNVRTQPLRLTVKGEPAGQEGSPLAGAGPSIPTFEPGVLDPSAMPSTSPDYPRWSSGFLSDPESPTLDASSPAGGIVLGTPSFDASKPAATAPARVSAEPAEEPAGTFGNPWFWISLVLAVTLAGVLGRQRGRMGTPRADLALGAAAEPPPPDPLTIAVEAVRAAYQRVDGAGAREALLQWGRVRWPHDPPGNLSRLARRCAPPLRDHITQLEKAFFSPDPIHWERDPVPDELLAQSPPGGPDAAAA